MSPTSLGHARFQVRTKSFESKILIFWSPPPHEMSQQSFGLGEHHTANKADQTDRQLRTIVRIHDERFMREASDIRSIFQATHLLCPEESPSDRSSSTPQSGGRQNGTGHRRRGLGAVVELSSNTATVG